MPNYTHALRAKAQEFGATVYSLNSYAASSSDFFLWLRAQEAKPQYLGSWSDIRTKEVFTQLPVRSEIGYFVALHELGHTVTLDAYNRQYPPGSPEAEALATKWALDNLGFTPSSHTARMALEALESYYVEGAKDIDGSIIEDDGLFGPRQDAGPLTHEVVERLHQFIR